jgi:hypothetical protein
MLAIPTVAQWVMWYTNQLDALSQALSNRSGLEYPKKPLGTVVL